MNRALIPLVFAAGCIVTDAGGQSGTALPPMCVEDGRVAVDDLTLAAEGFDYAPQEVVDRFAGSWIGDLAGDALVVDVQATGLAEAISRHLEEPEGDDTGPQTGAADPDCPWAYEIGLTVTLSHAGGLLDESFDSLLVSRDASGGTFNASIPLADLGGSAVPTFDPARWEHTDLVVDAYREGDELRGWLGWQGYTDDPGGDEGTVYPSGETETLANLVLVPME